MLIVVLATVQQQLPLPNLQLEGQKAVGSGGTARLYAHAMVNLGSNRKPDTYITQSYGTKHTLVCTQT